MKEHNKRKISQFCHIKKVCHIVNDPSMKATIVLRMDWSENAELFQCRQEKSNYYFDIQVPVNTAVVYQCNDSVQCVGSLSDNTDHKNAAVWPSSKTMLSKINLNMEEIEQLFIITDSPTSQYHNKGCPFLTKRFAEENDVDVTWITESGHGKGPMDGVGAAIKNSINNVMIAAESIPNMLVHHAAVVPILNLVDVEICHYDTNHIDIIKEILPGSKTLSINCKKFGISKGHEFFFSKEQSQKILWKMNSEDSKYTNAAFIIKSKAPLALLQENNSDDENMQSNDASESESGEEDTVESDEESDVD